MATKKEKVHFSHGDNFESVEDLLTDALEKLDEANERIARLLESGDQIPMDAAPESPEADEVDKTAPADSTSSETSEKPDQA